MNKQRILELTGMSEDQFYDAYPDQESFCSDYPEACAQLQQAQGGMQTYNREQPLDVISPLVARYTLPKGMVDNSKPIEKMTVPRQVMSPKQTMYNVGSTGTSYITPIDTEYKNGGNWIKKAIKHPGRCTPGSPNYDCPKGSPQWNLAQTFKKHHGFHEEGGTNIFPAMRNFKHGGYYGMDGKFHPNSDSGTYVGGAGYYFETGGGSTSSAAGSGMAAGAATATASAGAASTTGQSSFASNEAWKKDDVNGGYLINTDYDPKFGEDDNNNKQFGEDADEKNIKDYDASMYSSEIDPNTGFRKWSYNNQEIRNIKKDNPALWEHLKEEGHGARWETGQTDIQKVGRTAGAIGRGLENAVNVAGAIGNYLSNRQKQQNLDKAAMNMGSTASMFTNPEGSSKGDYGVTGSAYGMFKPNQTGNYSFKGMYGKYGMQVPKYAVGGFEPQIETLVNYGLEGPEQNIPVPINYTSLYTFPSISSDNTRVAPPIIPLDIRQKEIDYNNLKSSPLPNPNGKDIATKLNNPGNIIYSPIFSKLFGAVKSNIKQKDGSGYFAAFPSLDAGLKARETQLFGEVDGIFKSNYYNPDTTVDQALKTWSNKGYGVEIYPELKGKTLQEITLAQRKELMKRQIKRESGNLYKQLVSSGYFKNGGQQLGGQVVEMDENEIQQFLKAGGQLEFID